MARGEPSEAQPSASLANKCALVTGAAKGIGAAVATLFAENGARVVAVDVDAGALEELAHLERIEPVVADVTDPGFPARVVHHEPDVLVNNVGDFLRPPLAFADADPEEWDGLAEINLGHALRLTRALLPGMIERGRGGSIINLTTVEAHRGIPGHVLYSTYKAALRHFTRSLALEVGPHRIRVNNIAPDLIEVTIISPNANPEEMVAAWEASPLFHDVTTELGRDDTVDLAACRLGQRHIMRQRHLKITWIASYQFGMQTQRFHCSRFICLIYVLLQRPSQ